MSLELLRETRKAADSLGVPVSIHAAYNVVEFFQIVTEHGMTPIELLDSVGLCASDVLIGHGNFVAENPRMNYPAGRDLELMARAGRRCRTARSTSPGAAAASTAGQPTSGPASTWRSAATPFRAT